MTKLCLAALLLFVCIIHYSSQTNKTTGIKVSEKPRSRSISFDLKRRFGYREQRNISPGKRRLFSVTKGSRNRRKQRHFRSSKKTLVTRIAANIQRILLSINCRRAKRFLTSVRRCQAVQSTSFEQMRFYIARPRTNTLYSAILPDGELKDSTTHHAVAAVDPFPNVGFGHLVFIFYVDEITKLMCQRRKGIQIDPLLCLTLAKKAKCRSSYRSQFTSEEISQKCEVNFLPFVYDDIRTVEVSDKVQQLQCISYVAGFGACPKQPVEVATDDCLFTENSHKCQTQIISKKQIHPTCQLFATCDHAVLMFGEWNNLTFNPHQEHNIQQMHKMLLRNGFHKNNIQVFYGESKKYQNSKFYDSGAPSSDKISLRNYITKLCKTDLCVDNLILYLNGPVRSDGSILLQDLNLNGEAEDNEIYKVDEIWNDLRECSANRVIVMADQSYSGVLRTSLRHRLRVDDVRAASYWNRIVLLTSGNEKDYSYWGEITAHWSKLSPKRSLSWAFEELGPVHSSPTLSSHRYAEDHTIYGAPTPQLSSDDLTWTQYKRNHMGCQKFHHSQWMVHFSNNF